jgi:hypothetical protein
MNCYVFELWDYVYLIHSNINIWFLSYGKKKIDWDELTVGERQPCELLCF